MFLSLLGCISLLPLLLVACGPNQNAPESSPTYVAPKKGNPKLDSQLNQLVAAQANGEAASFARQANIPLDNGRVRVVIECVPGQLDAASKAAVTAGAVVETTYENLIQVLIPVTALNALADAESIKTVRLPQQPVPGANK